jgi:protease IV
MRIAVLLALIAVTGPRIVRAQAVDRRYAEEPTGGLALPATPMTGEHDARAVTINPGGLVLLRGPELALALDLQDQEVATSAGAGFGTFFATSGGGGIAPRFGFGMALEWLRPPRAQLVPDPGQPFRLTTSFALAMGARAGLGLAWHHFAGDGPLGGRDSVALGYSSRWGNHLAIGAVVRDLATRPIADTPVQRRYELETLVRPLGTDRLDLAIGGRIGETRRDVDGWARMTVRVARGAYVTGAVETRELYAFEDSPAGLREVEGRDVRATLGIELSFGGFGVAAYGTGLRDERGGRHASGSTFVLKTTSLGPPSVLGRDERIERIELAGAIGARKLTQHVVRLRAIARDPSAKALVVTFDGVQAGWATLQELRGEIAAVRKAGKKVFAYMVSGTGRDYFIATAADKIYVDPAGGLRLVGMAGTTMYFRGAFDQVGVSPEFEKIAEYKSAPEQLTQTGASEDAARMAGALYDSLWQQWLAAIAEGRKLSVDDVKVLVDAGPYTAGDLAADTKLVDAVAPPDKISQLIVAELGRSYPVAAAPAERPDAWQRPGVAVIYVEGDITDGKSQTLPLIGRDLAGGETLMKAISSARTDPRVGAIILRIDSPGGSAVASELVSREVFATRGVKPILCSLSDLAASGGYYIAAGCDLIFAEPMTITGSIGIFSGKFDIGALAAKLGITTETQKRGARSDAESWFRPYTDDEREALRHSLRYMYSRFIGAVADGRKLTKEQVDERGRGYVYSGAGAQAVQLVDRFGGLGDALDEAKRRMGLSTDERVQLYELPQPQASLFGKLLGLFSSGARAAPAINLADLPFLRELLRGLPASVLVSPHGAHARLPYEIVFE